MELNLLDAHCNDRLSHFHAPLHQSRQVILGPVGTPRDEAAAMHECHHRQGPLGGVDACWDGDVEGQTLSVTELEFTKGEGMLYQEMLIGTILRVGDGERAGGFSC